MPRKYIPVIALVLALSVVAGVLFSPRVSAANTPGLFHNDEKWYKDSSASLEMIDGIAYVPIDIFGMFSRIELSVDSRRGEFMLYNRASDQYISVLYNEKIATVNGVEEIYLNLYKLHGGYYYVPAEYFCSVLSLQYEIADSDASVYGKTVRISDGGAKQTLSELLSMYDPGSADSTDTPPVTGRPPASSGTDRENRTVYLTFNTVHAKNTETVLKMLETASVQATFVFTREELLRHASVASHVVADGHTIALNCTQSAGVEDFLRRMNEANELLYAITKTKTRIACLPSGTEESAFTEAEIDAILQSGYVLWEHTYDVPDSMGYTENAVKNRTLAAIREAAVSVLRLSTNDTVVSILPSLLNEFAAVENYRVWPISAGAQEIRVSSES